MGALNPSELLITSILISKRFLLLSLLAASNFLKGGTFRTKVSLAFFELCRTVNDAQLFLKKSVLGPLLFLLYTNNHFPRKSCVFRLDCDSVKLYARTDASVDGTTLQL